MEIMSQKVDHEQVVSGEEIEPFSLKENARNNFIKKVYSILAIQMLVTCLFVMISLLSSQFRNFQAQNQWLFWTCFVLTIVFLIILVCVKGASIKFPINILLLFGFTICQSYVVSFICTLYTPESVLNAAIATLGATIGLTLYAIKTKSDFSDWYSKCYGFLWAFFCFSMMLIILNLFIHSEFLHLLLAVGIGALYSFYLIVDTQLVMGGRNQEMSLDNYVLGAAMLYIDIIQIFLSLLRILGKRN